MKFKLYFILLKIKKIFCFKKQQVDDISIHPSNFISNVEFSQAVKHCLSKNNLTIEELSVKIQIPSNTIKKWTVGTFLPMPSMRKSVIVALEKIDEKNI